MDAENARLTADALIAAVASRQHGLVAYRQLLTEAHALPRPLVNHVVEGEEVARSCATRAPSGRR